MSEPNNVDNDFLDRITEITEENLSNDRFGVSELARKIGMSRSNLLRKVKKNTKLSVSQFIRKVRLENAKKMLRETSFTVSEISYKVGFSSSSYFVKCFHEYYGYSPGKAGKREDNEIKTDEIARSKKFNTVFIWFILITLSGIILLIVFKSFSKGKEEIEKSIAVLPFKNDSNDSANIYIINGLMESILNNLQKIEDLRVVSRTSVEKYRYSPMIIPEIAKELNVSYFVEGSGQKINDQILLNIQLIEASTDKHIWSEQYTREAKDIFKLQREVAKSIADEIEVIITPEEEARIDKPPTDDLIAYDYFLKGYDLLNDPRRNKLEEAIEYFQKAIDQDNEFARAYAAIAIAYYLMDEGYTEKKHSPEINNYADKALLYDPQLPQSLIAKALFYMSNEEYETAVSYFERALEYHPNSDLVYLFLVDLYANHLPDTEKYLQYAIRGLEIDIGAYDSTTISYNYLHISNAFIQSGFVDEAEKYINRSLDYLPGNLYSEYVKAYILYARNRDLRELRDLLLEASAKDPTRLDIMQEVGKAFYYLRDYTSSYNYYKPFADAMEAYNLDGYRTEYAKIAVVLSELGYHEEAEEQLESFRQYSENDPSLYKNLNLSMYYSFTGDAERAIEYFKMFSEEDNYHYWLILFLKIDPLVDNMKQHPEFDRIYNIIETKFRKRHNRIRKSLEAKGII